MTTILVYGSIFNGLRTGIHKWGNNKHAPFNFLGKFLSGLISCMLCTGTWVGSFCHWHIFHQMWNIIGLNEFLSVFL
jgi:hypothetical protein